MLHSTVMPKCRFTRSNSSMTIFALRGSSEATGSSARMMSGSCTSARQIATRCCWPPERLSARCAARLAISSICSADIAMARSSRLHSLNIAPRESRCASRPISTLFSTSSRPTRLNCWKIIAQRRRQSRSGRALQRGDVTPVPGDAARARLDQAVDHPQHRRLARAGPADHADELAARNLDRHAVHRINRAELPCHRREREASNVQFLRSAIERNLGEVKRRRA